MKGLLHAFLTAELNGDHFTDEEIIANVVVTMGEIRDHNAINWISSVAISR